MIPISQKADHSVMIQILHKPKRIDPSFKHHLRAKQRKVKRTSLIDPEYIIRMVFRAYDLKADNRLARTRKREYVQARYLSMVFINDLIKPRLSQSKIASYFEKDHATFIHACKAIDKLLFQYPEYVKFVNILEKNIKEGVIIPTTKVPAKVIEPMTYFEGQNGKPIIKAVSKPPIKKSINIEELTLSQRRFQVNEYKNNFIGRMI